MDTISIYFDCSEEVAPIKRKESRKAIRNACKDIFQLSNAQFIKNFRLNKAAFKYVLNEIKTKLPQVVKSSSLTPEFKLAATLRFLAEGGYQNGVGQDCFVGMAQSTVSVVLSEVLDILENILCPKWLTLKMSEAEKNEARLYFYAKSKIPGIVMCVDGTHIKIAKPANNPHLFYNRKGFYSLNVMIICDHKLRIRCVDATYPGASHDSFIWGNGDAAQYFKNIYNNGDRNQRVLADAGYPLLPWLITPYRNAGVNTQKSRFNKSHSSARNIVERTIGVWKNWCRCLLGVARHLHYSPEKSIKIINVAAALHNIRVHFNVHDGNDDPMPEEFEDHDDYGEVIHSQEDQRYLSEANDFRNQVLLNF